MTNTDNIKRFDINGLRDLAVSLGEGAYRGNQLAQWLYLHGAQNFDQMNNLSKSLRAKLTEKYELFWPEIIRQQEADDGTRKYLLRLVDGLTIETVAIVSGDRLTVCFSTQAGCAMGCVFCATGRLGLERSLSCGEMVDQLLVVAKDFDRRITNVVAMGQGEPFSNYDATLMALRLINNPELLGIGARHITISTCGLVRQLRRFASEPEQFTLAVSLHSAVQETRDKLMPGLTSQPLDSLHRALLDYMTKTSRRPSLEYALINGVNDTQEQLDALIEFCTVPAPGLHVNLIRLNSYDSEGNNGVNDDSGSGAQYLASGADKFKEFERRLMLANVGVSIRASKGSQIAAACGQLASQQ
jgi:23S rRNA (adenine2503-C2)-methyltransferase